MIKETAVITSHIKCSIHFQSSFTAHYDRLDAMNAVSIDWLHTKTPGRDTYYEITGHPN